MVPRCQPVRATWSMDRTANRLPPGIPGYLVAVIGRGEPSSASRVTEEGEGTSRARESRKAESDANGLVAKMRKIDEMVNEVRDYYWIRRQ